MSRWDFINRAGAIIGGINDYLEVGVNAGDAIRRVTAGSRLGIDVGSRLSHPGVAIEEWSSDDFFQKNEHTFNVVFIARHEHDQAYRDITAALDCLKPGGVIVVHNCNPTDEAMQIWPPVQAASTGNVWIAIARLRAERPDLHVRVVDADYGVAVIARADATQTSIELGKPYADLAWSDLAERRAELLGLLSPLEWERWLAGVLGRPQPLTFSALTMIRYDLMVELLRSVLAGTFVPERWHIIDNGPGGGWQDYFDRSGVELPGEVIFEHFGRNIGTSAGWNWIIDKAPGQVWIANDDLRVAPHTLELMLAQRHHALVCAHSFGLFLFDPAQMIPRVGYFDENMYPALWEDTEYQVRMKLAGVPPVAVPGACFHHTSQTVGRDPRLGDTLRRHALYFRQKWGKLPEGSLPIQFNGRTPPGWQIRPIRPTL